MAAAIRQRGFLVHTLRSIYGEQQAQLINDTEWIRMVGDRRWLAFTKDDRVRRERLVRIALQESGARVFCLASGNLPGHEQERRFLENLDRIIRQGRRPGPYVFGVYGKGIAKLWP